MKRKDSDLKACSASPPHPARNRHREERSPLYRHTLGRISVPGEKRSKTRAGARVAPRASLTNCCAAGLPPQSKEGRADLRPWRPGSPRRGLGPSGRPPQRPKPWPWEHAGGTRVAARGRGGVLGAALCCPEGRDGRTDGGGREAGSQPPPGQPALPQGPATGSHPTSGGISTHARLGQPPRVPALVTPTPFLVR